MRNDHSDVSTVNQFWTPYLSKQLTRFVMSLPDVFVLYRHSLRVSTGDVNHLRATPKKTRRPAPDDVG